MDFEERIQKKPDIDPTAFIAPTAAILGDVTIGPGSSVWFHVVLRGDAHSIRIGARTNVQDLAMMHGDRANGDYPVVVGDDVTIGHSAIVHGCTIGNRVMVGMGAIILNGAVIGDESIVAAGAVVREGTVVPPRTLVAGIPAKVRREIDDAGVQRVRNACVAYDEYSAWYSAQGNERIEAMLKNR